MKTLLFKARLWIIALPYALVFFGAAINQLAIIANHDSMPVLASGYKVKEHASEIMPDGEFNSRHQLMTPSTRLNFLGDIFDFESETDSLGDLFIQLGQYLNPFAYLLWGVLMVQDKVKSDVVL